MYLQRGKQNKAFLFRFISRFFNFFFFKYLLFYRSGLNSGWPCNEKKEIFVCFSSQLERMQLKQNNFLLRSKFFWLNETFLIVDRHRKYSFWQLPIYVYTTISIESVHTVKEVNREEWALLALTRGLANMSKHCVGTNSWMTS